MKNYKSHLDEITTDFCDKMQAMYLNGYWGINVGYKTSPLWKIRLDRTIGQWQEDSDCSGLLCEQSKNSEAIVVEYPVFGFSPFPQITQIDNCWHLAMGKCYKNAVPQNITLLKNTLSILQYAVDNPNGPVGGTSTFIVSALIGKNINIAIGVVLENGTDFTFDPAKGLITLLKGRLFNSGEIYTIFSY